jgi:hypothetical protein
MSSWQTGWDANATSEISFKGRSYRVHQDIMISAFSAWMVLGKHGIVVLEPNLPFCTQEVILDLLDDVYKPKIMIATKEENDPSSEEKAFLHALGKVCLAEFLGVNDWLRNGLIKIAKDKGTRWFVNSTHDYYEDAENFYRDRYLIDVMQNINVIPELDNDVWQMKPWINLGNSSKVVMEACREMAIARCDNNDTTTIKSFVDNCCRVLDMPKGELHTAASFGRHGWLKYSYPEPPWAVYKNPVCIITYYVQRQSHGNILYYRGLGIALSEFYRDFFKAFSQSGSPTCLEWFWWVGSKDSQWIV